MSTTDTISALAAGVVRGMERLRLRGAPTLFRLVSIVPRARETTSTIVLPSGCRICFPTFDAYWARYLWGAAAYEPDVEFILRRLGKVADKLLIDCGANIGYWTIRASEPEFGFTQFVAVEPNPRLLPLLERNVKMNGIACRIEPKALTSMPGEIVHLQGADQHASAMIGNSGLAVETTSLDALVTAEQLRDRLAVVKLDVEGSEIDAVQGARRLGSSDLIFVYEDWPRSGLTVTDFFLGNGYAVLGAWPGRLPERIRSLDEAATFNRATHTIYGPSNLIAARPDLIERTVPLFM